MPAYIALLRGVNVGGKTLKMELVRKAFEELGFSAVRSYVQSGNIIFKTAQASPASLAKRIEERILRDSGLTVSVFVKTPKEMENVIRNNPFANDKGIDHSKFHVTFLSSEPPKEAMKLLGSLAAKSERFQIVNQEVYFYLPDGYGKTRLSNNTIERKLSTIATTRNWRTVNTLLEMAATTSAA